jgi:hypothetical protein
VELKTLAGATNHPKTTVWRAADDLRAHGVVQFVADKTEAESKEESKEDGQLGRWILREEWRKRWDRLNFKPRR